MGRINVRASLGLWIGASPLAFGCGGLSDSGDDNSGGPPGGQATITLGGSRAVAGSAPIAADTTPA